MKVFLFLSLWIPLIIASGHDYSIDKKTKDDVNEKYGTIKRANAEFAINLYQKITAKEPRSLTGNNLILSPLSISTAFAMLAQGTKSTTHQQIIETLSFNGTENDQKINEGFLHILQVLNAKNKAPHVDIGNAIFVQERMILLESFRETLRQYYQADLKYAMFTKPNIAEKQINDYVREKTDGKIKDLVKDLDPTTVMVLLNYILFKGEWVHSFDKKLTKEEEFFVTEHISFQVPTMQQTGLYKVLRDHDLHCKVIKMPYKYTASLYIVVPKLGNIHQLEKALSLEVMEKWMQSLKNSLVELYLPKLDFSSEILLKEILQIMGMKDVFTPKANLSGISGTDNLYVSKAFHRAALKVNEFGTEASGATAIEVNARSTAASFKVNRAFLLFIHDDKTNSILFMGRVMDPRRN
ncbi:serine protease inhibitor A6-like [Pelobates fuscus]|uniref:serine protease inhibitor A6-like n=1 Tax=Pelobates fuscus TaxID=191477 RepID=UPI002FE4554A